jgi:hypothetical protein
MEKSAKRSLHATSPEDQNTMHAMHLFLIDWCNIRKYQLSGSVRPLLCTRISSSNHRFEVHRTSYCSSRCNWISLHFTLPRFALPEAASNLPHRFASLRIRPSITRIDRLYIRERIPGVSTSEDMAMPSQAKRRHCSPVDIPATGMHVRDDH